MHLTTAISFFVAVAAWVALIARACFRLRADAIQAIRKALAPIGGSLHGNPFDSYVLRTTVEGIDVQVHNRAVRKRPGAREDDSSKTVCAIELPLDGPDLIVCRMEEVDAVMGPLPSAVRKRSGHAAFDAQYAIFASAAEPETGPSYRGPPLTKSTAWAQPAVVERLIELKLQWMRLREGRGEVVFEPFEAEDAVRGVRTCANIARAISGAQPERVEPGPPIARRQPMEPLWVALIISGNGLGLASLPGLPLMHHAHIPLPEGWFWCVGWMSAIGAIVGTIMLRKHTT